MAEDLKKMYKTIVHDHFPANMEISFVDGNDRQTLFYEKVLWEIKEKQRNHKHAVSQEEQVSIDQQPESA